MKIKKIKNLIILKYNLILFIFMISFFLLLYLAFSYYCQRNFIASSLKYCQDVSNLIEKLLGISYFIQKPAIEKSLFSNLDARVSLFDPDGKVLFDNKVDYEKLESNFNRVEIIKARKNITSYKIRFSKTLNEKLFYFSKAIINKGVILGFIRISKNIDNLKKCHTYFFLFLGFFSLFVFFIFNLFLNDFVSVGFKIIEFTKENIEKINKKNFEFYHLKPKFSFFPRKLKIYFENTIINELQNIKNKIKSNEIENIFQIFKNFTEPVLLFSKEGLCFYANDIAKRDFIPENYWDNYEEKYYWEIFLDKQLVDSLDFTYKNKKNSSIEYETKDKYYFMKTLITEFFDLVLVIFYDISEIKNYFELRKGILSAISHELKTPLTSINGFLDQIIIEAENKNDQQILSFAQIAKRNSLRLIAIAEDVIEIEKMAHEKNIELIEIDLIQHIDDLVLLFSQKATMKNIDLKFESELKTFYFKTNPNLLDQILVNLIDNAIKFTEKGFIKITLRKKDEKIIIGVEDSGIGIEKSEIPKIFEPFYSIDKSYSKGKRSTGLGLSITKKAVEKLNGEIELISEPFNGSKFFVKLPI